MIFPLIEQVFNGSVTMDVIVCGIEAPDYEAAVAILRAQPSLEGIDLRGTGRGEIGYTLSGGTFPVSGYLRRKPLTFLTTP